MTDTTIMPVKCKRCGNDWKTKSLNFYVSCPRCHYTNKIRELKRR